MMTPGLVSRFTPRMAAAVIAIMVSMAAATPSVAQPQAAGEDVAGLPPGEAVRLFDAYALMRAREMLALTDQQYGPFVQQFTRLQEVRRRHLQARNRLLGELQRLTRPEAAPAESALKQALAQAAEQEMRAREESARAMAEVDGVLTLRQQVRFRVFEEHIERRKLELMSRARQGARRPAARR